MGVHVDGAGAAGDVLLATISSIAGNTLTLSVAASTTVTGASVGDDDTLAIRGAMSTFCASITNQSSGGSIYFPAGNYMFSQPQSSNANGIPFNTELRGDSLSRRQLFGAQRNRFCPAANIDTPAALRTESERESCVRNGLSNGNTTFENLVIVGCIEAVEAQGNVIHFKNTFLTVGVSGLTDNAPLHLWDTFWIFFDGGGRTLWARRQYPRCS